MFYSRGVTNSVCSSLFVFTSLHVFVSLPDGSVKKSFSGESRSRDRSQRASSDPQLKNLCGSQTLEQTVGALQTQTLCACD